MRVEVSSDNTVRTVTAKVEDGPDLINGWATWRNTPKPFRLRTITITVRAGQVDGAILAGPHRKKDGSDAVNVDRVQLYKRDLAGAPEWLRTMISDLAGGVTNATYATPATTTIKEG